MLIEADPGTSSFWAMSVKTMEYRGSFLVDDRDDRQCRVMYVSAAWTAVCSVTGFSNFMTSLVREEVEENKLVSKTTKRIHGLMSS